MRQVNRDEFTYAIFAALRRWRFTQRRAVFAPIAKRRQMDVWCAAQEVTDALRLGKFEFWTPSMEPLSRDPMTAIIEAAIEAFPGAIGKLWLSGIQAREHEARATAANLIADALADFEVLSEAPYGTTLFFPDTPRHAHALAPTWP